MPQDPIRTYKVGNDYYDIPESKVAEFLKDAPDAQEYMHFAVGQDKYRIPKDSSASFLKDFPDAKDLNGGPSGLEQAVDNDNARVRDQFVTAAAHQANAMSPEPLKTTAPSVQTQGAPTPTPPATPAEPEKSLWQKNVDVAKDVWNTLAGKTVDIFSGAANFLSDAANNMPVNSYQPLGGNGYGREANLERVQKEQQEGKQIAAQNSKAIENVRQKVADAITTSDRKQVAEEVEKMPGVGGTVARMTAGVAGMAPVMAAAMLPGGQAAFFAQGYQDGLDEVKDNDKIDPNMKTLYATALGTVNTALMSLPIGKALDKAFVNKVASKVVVKALDKAVTDAGGKLTGEALNQFLNSARDQAVSKLKIMGAKALKGGAEGLVFGVGNEAGKLGAQQGVNALENKQVFETPDFKQFAENSGSNALSILLLNGITGIAHVQTKDYLKNLVANASEPGDLNSIHGQINALADKEKISSDNAAQLHNAVDTYAKIRTTLPNTMTPEQTAQAFDLIQSRDEIKAMADPINQKIQELSDQKKALQQTEDPALQSITAQQIGAQVKDLNTQLGHIIAATEVKNDQIREVATGQKYTYKKKSDGSIEKKLGDGDWEPMVYSDPDVAENIYDIQKLNQKAEAEPEAEQPENIHTPQTPETTQTPKTPASKAEPIPEEVQEQPTAEQPEQPKRPGIHVSAPEPELPEIDKIAVKKPSASTNTVEANSKIHVETPEERFVPDKESKISVKLPKGKEEQNAVQKQSPGEVDVRQQAPDGEGVGAENPEPEKSATESAPQSPKTLTEPKTESNIKEGETKRIGKYNVTLKEGELHIRDDKGKEPSASTLRRVKKAYEEAYNYTRGKRAPNFPEEDRPYITEEEHDNYLVEHSENPRELAEVYTRQQPREPNVSFKEDTINQYGLGKISYASFRRFGDKNQLDAVRGWIGKKSKGAGDIDAIAQEFSDMTGVEFTPEDIVNYMMDHRKGEDIGKGHINDIAIKAADKFKALTGLKLNRDNAERISNYRHGEQPADTEKFGKGPNGEDLSPNTTGIKNEVTTAERRAAGQKEVEVLARRTFGQVFEEGKRQVDEGEINIRELAHRMVSKPRPLTPEESVALLYDRMRLSNEYDKAVEHGMKAIKAGDKEARDMANAEMGVISQLMEENDIAARRTGYEQGLGLAIRRLMIKKDYSLANQMRLMEVATGGKVTPEIRQQLIDLTQKLKEAQQKLEEYQEAKAQRNAQARVDEMAAPSKKEARAQKRKTNKEAIHKERAALVEELRQLARKQAGTMSSMPVPVELLPVMTKLAKNYIKEGIVKVEEIVDRLHDSLKDIMPDVTKRDIRDALTGYGKVTKPNQDEVLKQLRDVKATGRLISALEDAEQGERPKKSGFQREEPSQRVRELRKKVNDAMKEHGIDVTPRTGEQQMKSALDGIKKRLRNQIEDLERQIETGEKSPEKKSVPYDEEALGLKAERDRLKDVLQQMEGPREMSDEQRIKVATSALEKSIQELERRISERDISKKAKTSKTPSTPELEALRDRKAKLQADYEAMKEEINPKLTPEQRALKSLKTRLENRKTELERRLREKDYEVKPRKKTPVDKEALALQSEVAKYQKKLEYLRLQEEKRNRTTPQKVLDAFLAYRRGILLSSVTTLGKLTSAAATRGFSTPIEEIAGVGLRYIPGLSKIADMAPREGSGFRFKDEAAALKEIFSSDTGKDFLRILLHDEGQLHSMEKRQFPGPQGIVERIADIPGRAHQALKNPIKRSEFIRSYSKRVDWYQKHGFDISDPTVENTILAESLADANRAIFLQDNGFIRWYNRMVDQGLKSKSSEWNRVVAYAAKVLLPIVKVPTNFAGELMSYQAGYIKAMPKLIKAIANGVDNLKPEEADFIMRNFKKNTIGIAAMALGYYAYDKFAGLWYHGRNNKDGTEPDTIDLFGVRIPRWLIDAPILTEMQIGATIHRIRDQYEKHGKKTSVFTGGWDVAKAIGETIPFVRESMGLMHATETTTGLMSFSGNFLAGILIPPDVQRWARSHDKDENDKPIVRKPKTFWQYVEENIPGLRQNIPKKGPKYKITYE